MFIKHIIDKYIHDASDETSPGAAVVAACVIIDFGFIVVGRAVVIAGLFVLAWSGQSPQVRRHFVGTFVDEFAQYAAKF